MLKWLLLVFSIALLQATQSLLAQQTAKGTDVLQRRYTDGAVSHYLMTGNNDGWQYTIKATDLVKRDAQGRYYEEIRWSDLTSNAHQSLDPASLALRQTVSLDDPADYLKVPNLAGVQPLLIGPITDTLTFYSDLLLAMKAKLVQPGQTAYFPRTTPNSWADGQRVVLGQDVVDFSLKVESADPAKHTETIMVQHVPPPSLHIQLPASWMRQQNRGKPDNFVQVIKQGDVYITEAGKETFDVQLVVNTSNGQLLSAVMLNPVVVVVRNCTNAELNRCGPKASKSILREITWKLIP